LPSAPGAFYGANATAAHMVRNGTKDILCLPCLIATTPAHRAAGVCCPVCQVVTPLQDRRARVHSTGHLCQGEHQQCKLQVWQHPSSPLLCSGLPPSPLLSSWSKGCADVATTLAILFRQVEKLTELTLPAPTRCIAALLAMVSPPPLPLPPSVGEEDDARSTYANSNPAVLAHAVCRAKEARTLLDQPLPAGHVGGKGRKGNGSNNDGDWRQRPKLDDAPDWDGLPHPPQIVAQWQQGCRASEGNGNKKGNGNRNKGGEQQ
jgi:hypothetical protein